MTVVSKLLLMMIHEQMLPVDCFVNGIYWNTGHTNKCVCLPVSAYMLQWRLSSWDGDVKSQEYLLSSSLQKAVIIPWSMVTERIPIYFLRKMKSHWGEGFEQSSHIMFKTIIFLSILWTKWRGMGVEGDTWGTSSEIQLRDHGGLDSIVAVEVLKEKPLSSLARELWTLGAALVRAQKEMKNILICCNRNQHTPLVGTLQFYPEATWDHTWPSKGTTIDHRYSMIYILLIENKNTLAIKSTLIHFSLHLKINYEI